VGMSLNIRATKLREPAVDVEALYQRLCERPLGEFHSVAAEVGMAQGVESSAEAAKLYQRIHFQLIEANARIRYLEVEKRRDEAELAARHETARRQAEEEAAGQARALAEAQAQAFAGAAAEAAARAEANIAAQAVRIAAQAAEIAAQARDIDKLWKWSPRRLLPGKRRRSPTS